jgi:SAM-dependent methyltransferase
VSDALYAEPLVVDDVESCLFYHRMDLPGVGTVGGYQGSENWWDLRGREHEYIGGIDLAGKRVLELGPGSGALSFFMESRGAEVVGVELADGAEWDIVPIEGLDVAAIRTDRTRDIALLRNGFWFAHRLFDSKVRIHLGTVYELPSDLGHFDVALFASVLLHLRDPIRAVLAAAQRADTIVVTERHFPELDGGPNLRLYPRRDEPVWHTWYSFAPEVFVQLLDVCGFVDTSVTFHSQHYRDGEYQAELPMYTVVASRPGA